MRDAGIPPEACVDWVAVWRDVAALIAALDAREAAGERWWKRDEGVKLSRRATGGRCNFLGTTGREDLEASHGRAKASEVTGRG
jgi:hypothetical protein